MIKLSFGRLPILIEMTILKTFTTSFLKTSISDTLLHGALQLSIQYVSNKAKYFYLFITRFNVALFQVLNRIFLFIYIKSDLDSRTA